MGKNKIKNYLNLRKAEILQTFDDFPVVLVQIMSANPVVSGKIVAISENTGGYESLDAAIINYNLLNDDSLAIGITSKCTEEMMWIEEGKPPRLNTESLYVSPKGYLHKEAQKMSLDFIKENIPDPNKPINVVDTSPQNLSYLRYEKPKIRILKSDEVIQLSDKQKETHIPQAQIYGLVLVAAIFIIFIISCFMSIL